MRLVWDPDNHAVIMLTVVYDNTPFRGAIIGYVETLAGKYQAVDWSGSTSSIKLGIFDTLEEAKRVVEAIAALQGYV